MIISRAEIDSVVAAARVAAKKRVRGVVTYDSVEAYEPSAQAQAIHDLAATVAADPFYRPALVDDLRRRVSEGKYHVPAEEIVEKLLGRLAAEAMATN